MLGNAADHFMLAQMRERVHAITPNAGGRSMEVPDRERPGTAQVTVKGGWGMPGPQRSVSSSFVPGMGGVATPPPAPSPASMLPGMGASDMLPGMGDIWARLRSKISGAPLPPPKPHGWTAALRRTLRRSMLPGMGEHDMLPGMGELSGGMKMGIALAAAIGLYLCCKK